MCISIEENVFFWQFCRTTKADNTTGLKYYGAGRDACGTRTGETDAVAETAAATTTTTTRATSGHSHVVLVEQGVQIQQQSENQMNNSILKPVSHQYIPREAVHEPPKLQTVQIIKNPTNFVTPQNHQHQFLNQSPGTVEIVGERQMDQAVRSPLKSITPVKYIAQGATKSQVQSIKIVQQEQSVQQVQLSGDHLSADGAPISRGSTIPVYVAMPTGSSAPQNQPKLLPVAVIAKPATHPHQPRQQKQVN